MKKYFLKSCALLIAIVIVISSLPFVTAAAAETQPAVYSKDYNSGDRDVDCTTLSGTSASSYYTGSYTYESLSSLSSSALLQSLRTLMSSTHKKITSYSDCKSYSDNTDCENEDGRVVLLYTSYSATMNDWISGSTGWNREHVWPQSLGGFGTSRAGADLHHIRPDDNQTNNTRGSKKFGEVSDGKQANGSSTVGGMSGGTYNSSYFEPHDNVKGDVARICLYVYARWGGEYSGCSSITTVFQSVDVLLEWCELDPVDTWEMGRNEVVQAIQGNRNVFIDYPEYAWLLFGEEVPSDMATPSGKASNGTAGGNTSGGNTSGGNTSGGNTSGGNTSGGNTSGGNTSGGNTNTGSTGNGTLEAPLTTTEAYNAHKSLAQGATASSACYVAGKITKIGGTGAGENGNYYKNVYITDGTTEVLIYTLNLTSGISSIKVGDDIVVHGYFKNYQGTIEMATNNTNSTYVTVVKLGTAGGNTGDSSGDSAGGNAGGNTNTGTTGNGTIDAPYTATQAYNAHKNLAQGTTADSACYVIGKITKIGEVVAGANGNYYKNVYITDGTTEVLIYTLNLTSGISGIEVGDTITVHGYFKNYQGTIEMATNNSTSTYVTVVKLGADVTDEPETNEPETNEPETNEPETNEPETNEPESNVETEIETELGTEVEIPEVDGEQGNTDVDVETEVVPGSIFDRLFPKLNIFGFDLGFGCGSSIAGGTVIVSVIGALAIALVFKKRDE